jgi:Tat protein translocase TatB subunit
MLVGVLNVGGGEILMILVVALIFLGPTRLPEAGRQVGRAIAEFRRMTSGVQRDLKDALDMDGVRESIDTFREVVDVRKNLVSEFASAAAHFTASPASSPAASTPSGGSVVVGDPAIPPPDGMFAGDSPALSSSYASAAPAPPSMFHDILMDPAPARGAVSVRLAPDEPEGE